VFFVFSTAWHIIHFRGFVFLRQERGILKMKQKKVFQIVFAASAVMLLVLPFVVSFNDVLTRAVKGFGWYRWIEERVVPLEVRLVGVMVKPLGIEFVAYSDGFTANDNFAKVSWNCIGWQSLLLFLVSLPFGFSAGKYRFFSKVEAFLIGFLGTFIVNLLRIVFTVVLLVVSRPLFAMVFHDYLAAVVTVVWLVVFWWFSYAFVLEERK